MSVHVLKPHDRARPTPTPPGDKVVVALTDADGVVAVDSILGNPHVTVLPAPLSDVDGYVCTVRGHQAGSIGEWCAAGRGLGRGEEACHCCAVLADARPGPRQKFLPATHPRGWNDPSSW